MHPTLAGMILVTGATGTIGSRLVRELLARGEQVRAMTHNPARLPRLPGLEPAATIDRADAVFLLTGGGPQLPEVEEQRIRAAVAAGIPRIVKLSAIGTPDDDVPVTRLGDWHQRGERAARASGMAWTILRPTTFALAWAGDIRAGRPVANLFGTGRQAIVDPSDVAAVAAEALTGTGHEGRTYTLTGPELLTLHDQVAQLGEASGRRIEVVEVPPEQAHEYVPAEFADLALEGAALVRSGGNAIVTDDVERVLGRRPGTFRAWAETNRDAFTGA